MISFWYESTTKQSFCVCERGRYYFTYIEERSFALDRITEIEETRSTDMEIGVMIGSPLPVTRDMPMSGRESQRMPSGQRWKMNPGVTR
jgi:hypothetical protein